MKQVYRRYIHNSTAFIQSIVTNTKTARIVTQIPVGKAKKKKTKTVLRKKSNSWLKGNLPNWHELNDTFNIHYGKPADSDLNKVNRFFNRAKVKFDWSAATFDDIPDQKQRNSSISKEIDYDRSSKHDSENSNGTTRVNYLPEVIFLGGTNVGKSSILNNITTSIVSKDIGSLARVSKTTGFTKTLNCYNVGNKFRMIDSPGYGFNSSKEQGGITLRYLLEREELVRCFLLLAGDKDINDTDNMMIRYMHEHGIPFEVVFTKMDKVQAVGEFEQKVTSSGLMDLPTLPRLVLTNSLTSRTSPKRLGVDLLRYTIFQSCGLIS
ncbi:translation initiation/elongation factor MRX8 SKDI_04G5480 [Saccharomyces kudriavzevii IFO 1802]|uniref:EngB-type G domain-containing protein n=1 Tax=Saccharomyces kudriavzevii (strain ATCC MYA-4449 / AS 2.2408 / CBS 8840 / NBRC 1802 / NCYC 2889) TaxID=226230 RepID=A0AA35JGQ7_SACK1|nr:uncharacterized protein SKDI_04G5480 [Saccharomyces kudriavzevii IFO 1802]CAI4058922.1 hypothetical protein SKDI_04G5480 [Saccharomyces kudriavzevii IFO 1802]